MYNPQSLHLKSQFVSSDLNLNLKTHASLDWFIADGPQSSLILNLSSDSLSKTHHAKSCTPKLTFHNPRYSCFSMIILSEDEYWVAYSHSSLF
jgi:hypothetical protein